ncbi:M81 family metallopeptidase [Castellaniella sp.]|uniref:M81 family metallopeptidase n=1 Tax=Castellaniella sp. TaxID=1955812 RepID=UPI002AFFE32F|nr:M81 family metallopeptidase [Castellaniella sp.]
MARIGILGFLHETNTFAPGPTVLERFIEADAWPGLVEGQALLAATQDMNLAVSGFIAAMQPDGHELVPLLWCSANPSGPVSDTAFEHIVARLETLLRLSGPLDALFLDLHGSMVTETLDDAEGVLLQRLRTITGPHLPYVAALDFHAIITQAMVDQTQAMVAYHSYPHVDMAATGARAAQMLRRILAGEVFHAAWHKLDFLVSMPWQSTLGDEPAGQIMAQGRALEAPDRPEVQFIPGFPNSDTPASGPAVLAYAISPELAQAGADALLAQVRRHQSAFCGHLHTPQAALQAAAAHPAARYILADTQDNPGGGGAGDTTGIAQALLAHGISNAAVALLCDADFAQAAHQAGVGAILNMTLGGRSSPGGPPLPGPYEVLALGSGQLTGTGPFYLGCRMDLGPMTRVRVQGTDLEILVSSRKQQAADQAMFHHLGADPRDYRILVLKSSVHFRADFGALADHILVVQSPGANTADLHALPYTRLRPGVNIL